MMIRDIILNKIGYYLWKHKIHQINIEYHEKYYDDLEDDLDHGTVWIKNPNGSYFEWNFDQVLRKCNDCDKFACNRCLCNGFSFGKTWAPYSGYNYRNYGNYSHVYNIKGNYVTRIESTIDNNGQNIVCFKAVALLPKNY